MRRPATVRARTTLLATVTTGLVLVVASVLLVHALSVQLSTSKDDASKDRVRELLVTAKEGSIPATLANLDDNSVEQIIDRDGRVVRATANVRGRGPIVAPAARRTDLHVTTTTGPDDKETETYRLWVASGPSPSGPVTVVVGHSIESIGEATRTLRRTLVVGVPLLLVLFALVMWLVVGRALRRIDRITETVSGIGEAELGRRVPETGVDDEVGRLAMTMNAMLARLQQSGERQRRFVADASHDLQSPLTGFRSTLEVALAHPDGVEVEPMTRQLLATSQDMEVLVQDLLAMALLDEEQPLRPMPLDLDQIALEEVSRLRPTTAKSIDTGGVSAAPVAGDPAELRRLVRNLVDNALKHAASEVVVSAGVDDDGVALTVADDGPGVREVDRERIFDRFHRGDPARTGVGGSGLGLSIARRIAERHGGRLDLVTPPSGERGARFRLWLPAAA